MKLYCVTALLVTALFPPPILAETGGWNDPTKDQFHIQTDEGPERYFKYQTHSGQYRKEKRLEDGTVIGSYGWIDQNGMLRLRDYIADNAGYRILKTKNVYVGRDRPISQAINVAKKVPASAGTLVKTAAKPVVAPPTNFIYSTTPAPVFSSTPVSSIYSSSTPCADCNKIEAGYPSVVHIGSNDIVSSTERPYISSTQSPIVSSTGSPLGVSVSHVGSPIDFSPSSTPRPDIYISSSTPSSGLIPSSTPATIHIPSTTYRDFISSTPEPFNYVSSTPADVSYANPIPQTIYVTRPSASPLPPPISSNSIDFYSSEPQYEHYETRVNPYVFRNGPTYPIDKNGNTFTGYQQNGNGNNLGNGYQPQYPEYDGVSVTNDGFRYYIPRAYHEEQNLGDNRKSGSFGYIDPFGIRRVIYYNAAPGQGFVHRKNNRYVGFQATPYDPRPY